MYALTSKMKSDLQSIGQGYVFQADIQHLDLVYGGEFETTFHHIDTPISLEELIESIINAVANQLEIDSCTWDFSMETLYSDILSELQFDDKTVFGECAVFFIESNGAEGQYYIIIKGEKSNK